MLTGALMRSAGLATVGGFDTETEMDLVYRTLGVCPQFDTIWDDLTVAEHLLFYCHLRGLYGQAARVRVQQTAEKVNLDGDSFNMRAAELSGGMQRRLSLGIALCGEPSVVLLDEPSTGLDPDTRRYVGVVVPSLPPVVVGVGCGTLVLCVVLGSPSHQVSYWYTAKCGTSSTRRLVLASACC